MSADVVAPLLSVEIDQRQQLLEIADVVTRLLLACNQRTRLDGCLQPRAFDFDAGAGSIDAQAIPLQQRFADWLVRLGGAVTTDHFVPEMQAA
jgi:hypothetical protein